MWSISKKCVDKVGPDFWLMADCWMSLDVPYAVELANALREVDLYWMEEVLHPGDIDGHINCLRRECLGCAGLQVSMNTPATDFEN